MTDRRWLWLLIVVSSVLRLAFAWSVGPGTDEAYHALFALHLDWSYFDHPPMMALIARLGMLLSGGRLSIGAMRVGFILLAAGSTWLMARLTTRFYGERAGLIAAFLLNVTAYYGVAAGTFILPDGPLLFFWLLTLDYMATAFLSPGRLGPWIGVGLAWGCALLSKYHSVFLPMGATLYMLLEPTARRRLRELGPYLAFGLGLLMFSPVIWWNSTHGWASFAFQGERAQAGGGFRPDFLALAVLGQVLYLLPWIWLPLWVALIRAVRASRDKGAVAERFFLSQAAVPTGIFLLVACQRMVLPHWSLVGMIPAFPLLGRDWSSLNLQTLRRRIVIFALVPLIGVTVFVVEARWGLLQLAATKGFGPNNPANVKSNGWISRAIGTVHWLVVLASANDPTVDMSGWDQVANELKNRGLLDNPDTFLFTSKWYHSGHLAFATGNRVPILCYSAKSAHNFAFWEDSAEWVGHDGILVVINETTTEPAVFDRWFKRIEPLAEFSVERAGGVVRRVRLFRCIKQLHAFPDLPTESDTATSKPTGLPPG
jgi:4-amino-4-deoxy-L-arabinose transferase-like glycosyltransferase